MGEKKARKVATAVALGLAIVVGTAGPAAAGPRSMICYYMPPWCGTSTTIWWWP